MEKPGSDSELFERLKRVHALRYNVNPFCYNQGPDKALRQRDFARRLDINPSTKGYRVTNRPAFLRGYSYVCEKARQKPSHNIIN